MAKVFPSVIARTYFGALIECDLREFIDKRIFHFGVWEPEVSNAIASCLKEGDLFVDIGANIGYDTLLARSVVGESGAIVSIEAASLTFKRLQRNLALNRASNVRAVNVAVSDVKGELELFSEAGNLGRSSSVMRVGASILQTVPTLPLEDILTSEELARVALIKIDIEGGELPVVEGILKNIDLYPAEMSLVVEMSAEESGRSLILFEALLALGFEAFVIPNDYSLESYLSVKSAGPQVKILDLPSCQVDIMFVRSRTLINP